MRGGDTFNGPAAFASQYRPGISRSVRAGPGNSATKIALEDLRHIAAQGGILPKKMAGEPIGLDFLREIWQIYPYWLYLMRMQ
jgi:hypothetical protein